MNKLNSYYKFLIVVIILFSMFFFLNKNISSFINKSSIKNTALHIVSPILKVNNYNIFNIKRITKEKNKLERQVIEQSIIKRENKNLKKEIRDLKEITKLTTTYSDTELVYAKTIIRNKMYWYSTLIIDKGSNNKIKENDIVVTQNGLIGWVKSTTKDYSTVKLITNSDKQSQISVMIEIEDNTFTGTIEGYSYPYLKVNIPFKIEELPDNAELYTSGLGNIPKKIYIGKAEKKQTDNYNLSTILYVKPKQNMNDINYVVILKNK